MKMNIKVYRHYILKLIYFKVFKQVYGLKLSKTHILPMNFDILTRSPCKKRQSLDAEWSLQLGFMSATSIADEN